MRERRSWGWDGCWCEFYSDVRYTIVNRSRRIFCHKGKGLVVKKTHRPVCIRERGGWGWDGCWCEFYSTVRYTIVNRSRRICCRQGKGLVVKKTILNKSYRISLLCISMSSDLCLRLLWIEKAKVKDKTYIWVSVWWKTQKLKMRNLPELGCAIPAVFVFLFIMNR